MKKTEIGRRVQEIDDKIQSLHREKIEFQNKCKHTQVDPQQFYSKEELDYLKYLIR